MMEKVCTLKKKNAVLYSKRKELPSTVYILVTGLGLQFVNVMHFAKG